MSSSPPRSSDFEWDARKDVANQLKHGVAFAVAQFAFADPCRVIAEDTLHGGSGKRWFCFGRVDGMVLTVRFTWRNGTIRIIGAGYWRKGKAIHEQQNSLP